MDTDTVSYLLELLFWILREGGHWEEEERKRKRGHWIGGIGWREEEEGGERERVRERGYWGGSKGETAITDDPFRSPYHSPTTAPPQPQLRRLGLNLSLSGLTTDLRAVSMDGHITKWGISHHMELIDWDKQHVASWSSQSRAGSQRQHSFLSWGYFPNDSLSSI